MTSQAVADAVIWVALFFLVCGPIHEFCHALVAWRLGDDTARLYGRLTLDPFVHFDPVGGPLLAFSVLIGLFTHSGLGFGWAKPTPVNPYKLRGRYANLMVAAAGPLSNLILAVVFAAGFRYLWAQGIAPNNTSVINMVQEICWIGVEINLLLMIFNLIPVPPLDGSHVLLDLLNPRQAREVGAFFDQYGLMMLIVVVLFLGQIIHPVFAPLISLLTGVQVL